MGEDELLAALFEFRTTLPGWWFRVGECSVSCDATVGPDAAHIPEPLLSRFDAGFDCDLRQPSSVAAALRGATAQAAEAVERFRAEADAKELAGNLLPQFVRAMHLLRNEPAHQLVIQPIEVLQQMKAIGLVKVGAQRETSGGLSETLVLSPLGHAVFALTASPDTAPVVSGDQREDR